MSGLIPQKPRIFWHRYPKPMCTDRGFTPCGRDWLMEIATQTPYRYPKPMCTDRGFTPCGRDWLTEIANQTPYRYPKPMCTDRGSISRDFLDVWRARAPLFWGFGHIDRERERENWLARQGAAPPGEQGGRGERGGGRRRPVWMSEIAHRRWLGELG